MNAISCVKKTEYCPEWLRRKTGGCRPLISDDCRSELPGMKSKRAQTTWPVEEWGTGRTVAR